MNKQQLIEERNFWRIMAWTALIGIAICFFITFIFNSTSYVKYTGNYRTGFQDGQANCTMNYNYYNETQIGYTYNPNFNYSNYFVLSNITYIEQDNSKEGYYQITTGKKDKFIFMECKEGTLEITNKTIGCVEKENSK